MHARWAAMRRRRMNTYPAASSSALDALSEALSAGRAVTLVAPVPPGWPPRSRTATAPTMSSERMAITGSARRSVMAAILARRADASPAPQHGGDRGHDDRAQD